jgi:hypothetical protein
VRPQPDNLRSRHAALADRLLVTIGDDTIHATGVLDELTVDLPHADAEERTFYAELKRIGRAGEANQLIGEHQEVKELMSEGAAAPAAQSRISGGAHATASSRFDDAALPQ